jgi:hypothetical protein
MYLIYYVHLVGIKSRNSVLYFNDKNSSNFKVFAWPYLRISKGRITSKDTCHFRQCACFN